MLTSPAGLRLSVDFTFWGIGSRWVKRRDTFWTTANPLCSVALPSLEFADRAGPASCPAAGSSLWTLMHSPEKGREVRAGFPLPLIWSRGAPNKPAGAVLCAACNGLVTALNFTELDQSCLECDRNGQASCTAPRAALAQCRDLLTQPRSLQQHTHTPRLWTFLVALLLLGVLLGGSCLSLLRAMAEALPSFFS